MFEEALAGGEVLGRALKLIKEQMRSVPHHGLGYGLLHYLNPATAPQLSAYPSAQIAFNYLGRIAAPGRADWGPAEEGAALLSGGDPAMPLLHVLEVNALALEGSAGVELTALWSYAPALVDEASVRELAECWFAALTALVRHTEQEGAGGRSPSDLPLLRLSQEEIERLEHEHPQIEDILPLTPLQEGLLFHALYDEQQRDVYAVQLDLVLEGTLDGGALRTAAQALFERHASLRAGFRHEDLSKPVQVILRRVTVPWRQVDLSGLEASERARQLEDLLAQDRRERFDLGTAPLVRFTLVRMSGSEHRLVLTTHHILLDGWSMPILVRELLTLYAGGGSGAGAGDAVPGVSGVAFAAGSRRGAGGVGGGAGGAGGWHASGGARSVAGSGAARAALACAQRGADVCADAAGARAGSDAEHLRPGGVGDPAGSADRAKRRGVRGDGGGASAGDPRHREHGGAVHQHTAVAGEAGRGRSRCSRCCTRCRSGSRG